MDEEDEQQQQQGAASAAREQQQDERQHGAALPGGLEQQQQEQQQERQQQQWLQQQGRHAGGKPGKQHKPLSRMQRIAAEAQAQKVGRGCCPVWLPAAPFPAVLHKSLACLLRGAGPLGSHQPTHLATSPSPPSCPHPFAPPPQEAAAAEREARRQAAEERARKLAEDAKRRAAKSKQLYKKTGHGQPVMKYRVERMLEELQRGQ